MCPYLVMEFFVRGNLMTMLIKYNTFSEDVTRFYVAERVLAIRGLCSYIHR